MQRPKVDDQLTLLTDDGKAEALCAEVQNDPALSDGVILKVLARGSFQQGQQCWIVDRDGSKIGATVKSAAPKQTIEQEVVLSAVFPEAE